MIRAEHLTKYYGSTKALEDVSFEVQDGEILGFLGPNGAGKTTTMKILTCFMPPTSGTAWINDVNIDEDPLAVREQMGYLPENNPLYEDFTVDQFLGYVAQARHIAPADRAKMIGKVVEECGLGEVYYKSIGHLSKGFRQRVGLAQALVHEPKILILDEPTVGLDPKQIIEVRDLIKKLGKKRTVMVSTHILQEVQAICDRVMIIDQGVIVASGTPDELKHATQETSLASIYLKVEGTLKEVEVVLKSIKGVASVHKVDEEKRGIYGYRVEIDKGADIRALLARTLADKSIPLLELTPEKISLEDVFIKLTK
jgi:ABC-2 type transport system ATP-binding protein